VPAAHFWALLVVSSEKPGAHTTPTSIPQASAAVSVPIRGRLCHLLVLHICMCKILAGLRRTSLGAHLLPPPSITRCCKASSVVFCVSVCACSASSACPQLHVHHGQERQTLWKKCCNAEKGAYLLGRICAPSLQLESTQVLPFSTYIYIYIYIYEHAHILPGLRRAFLVTFLNWFHPSLFDALVTRRDGKCRSLAPSLSLVTFSVLLFFSLSLSPFLPVCVYRSS